MFLDMAFRPIPRTDIVDCLKALNPPFRFGKNALHCLTLGLTDCYSGIATRVNSHPSPTSLSEDLLSPCVHWERESSYTDVMQLGSGAFSEVSRALR